MTIDDWYTILEKDPGDFAARAALRDWAFDNDVEWCLVAQEIFLATGISPLFQREQSTVPFPAFFQLGRDDNDLYKKSKWTSCLLPAKKVKEVFETSPTKYSFENQELYTRWWFTNGSLLKLERFFGEQVIRTSKEKEQA